MDNLTTKIMYTFLYLIAIIVYICQGILYSGNLFTWVSGLYILLFNLYCVFIYKGHILKVRMLILALLFILLLFFSWCISEKTLLLDNEKISTIPMLQNSIIVLTSIISFYYIKSQELLRVGILKVFIGILVIMFIYNILHFDVTGGGVAGEYDFKNTNNKAYTLCALFPFLIVFWQRKWLMMLLMLLSVVFTVICAKRGAIICTFASLLIVMWKLWFNKGESGGKWIKIMIVLICFIFAYFVSVLYEYSDLIQNRFEYSLDNGMGQRDSIYLTFYKIWLNSPFYNMILGNGPCSTIKFAKIYAHNDWLEILIDFGLFTLIIYCLFVFSIYKLIKRSKNIEIKVGIILVLIYILIRSTFSMCFYELESLLAFGSLGYFLGEIRSNSKKVYLNSKLKTTIETKEIINI